MEFVTLFQNFGYPALITGALLWIMTTKIEKLTQSNIDRTQELRDLGALIREMREDIRDLKKAGKP